MRTSLIALALAASVAGQASAQAPAVRVVRQPHCLQAGATIEIEGVGLPQSGFLRDDRRRVTHLITKSGSSERLLLEAPENARLGGEAPVSLWLDGAQTPLRLIETCRSYEPGGARSGPRFSIGVGVAGFGGGGDRDRRPRAQNPNSTVGRQSAPSTGASGGGFGWGIGPTLGFRLPTGDAGPDDRSRRADSNRDGVIDNEIVAYYANDADAARGAAAAAGAGYVVIADAPLTTLGGHLITYRAPRGRTALAGAAQLRALDARGVYDANTILEPAQRSNNAGSRGRTYAPQMLGWRRTPTCRPVLPIGIIDTGISVTHEGLAGARITTATFLKDGETPGNPKHGTAVAGILVGGGERGAGLFTTGRLYAAAAAEQSREGPFVRVDRAIAALDWLAAQGVQLVNISLAGRNNNAPLARTVRAASARGMVIVAAAGNGGPDAPPAYPAAYDDAIAVTAIGMDRALYGNANRGSYVDIAAPGVEIYAPGEPEERMWYFTGTSAAAPFVTARIAADGLPSGAGASQRVRAQLARNATDLGRPGPDTQFGAGLIGAPASCR